MKAFRKAAALILAIAMICGITACGGPSEAEVSQAYGAIGEIKLSDESILTDAEKAQMKEWNDKKETAYKDKDIKTLEAIKTEWEAFKAPIESYIDSFESQVRSTYLSASEESLLTQEELANINELKNAAEEAYLKRDEAALDKASEAYISATSEIRSIVRIYRKIKDGKYFSDTEFALLSSEDRETFQNIMNAAENGFANRDLASLEQAEREIDAFSSEAGQKIEAAKEQLLQNWVDTSNSLLSVTDALSLGSTTSRTSISGHTITVSVQYNNDYKDSQIADALDAYLRTTSYLFEQGVNYLKQYIDDVCIRVEYLNKNGSVVSSKDFR